MIDLFLQDVPTTVDDGTTLSRLFDDYPMLTYFPEFWSHSWPFFILVVLVGLLLFWLLQSVRQLIIERFAWPVSTKQRWANRLRQALLIYELFFVVVIGSLFVELNYIWHGMIVSLLILLTFPMLRNYITGRLLCFDRDFGVGKRIIIQEIKGVINHLNRLGIYVNTNNGIQYFNYQQLQEQGYSLVTDSSMEEYCDLNITIPPEIQPTVTEQQLLYRLMGSPYLDNRYKPILIRNEDNTVFRIRVLIRKGNHRKELLSLIKDWGYRCQLSH